jgi:hypothetical protein
MKKGGKDTTIEARVAEKVKRVRVQDALLLALNAGVSIGLAVTAPNALQLMKFFPQPSYTKVPIGKRVAQARSRLIARGLIKKQEKESGGVQYVLTHEGEAYVLHLDSEMHAVSKPKTWDRKWRVVIFDIWESRRDVRDALRRKLHNIGFVSLQASVWVYPYPCEDFIVYARTKLKLGPSLVYIVADEIENDERLRSHFKLV